jgi:hypothetical protein
MAKSERDWGAPSTAHCADQLIRGAGRRPAFVLGPCLQLLTPCLLGMACIEAQ